MSTQSPTFDTTATALDMAETMSGVGVEVVSATYTGDPRSSGIYRKPCMVRTALERLRMI
jgi:hypothetical protein